MLPETRNIRKQVKRNTQNVEDINDKSNRVFQRISKPALRAAAATPTRRARCAEDAPLGSTILADLYDEVTGVLATEGDEFGVTVHCNIANGIDLNETTPRLEIGLDIPVYRSIFDNAGTPESRWYYNGTFQASEDCTCGV